MKSKQLDLVALPREIQEWAETQPTPALAWTNCDRGDWLWRLLLSLPELYPSVRLSKEFNKANLAIINTMAARTRNREMKNFCKIVRRSTKNITKRKHSLAAAISSWYAAEYVALVIACFPTGNDDIAIMHTQQADWIRKHIPNPFLSKENEEWVWP
jgi:hypothetical protein